MKAKAVKDALRTQDDVDEAERLLLEARHARDKALVAKIVSALSLADLLAAGVSFSPAWVYDYKAKCQKVVETDREVSAKLGTVKRVSQKFRAADAIVNDPEED